VSRATETAFSIVLGGRGLVDHVGSLVLVACGSLEASGERPACRAIFSPAPSCDVAFRRQLKTHGGSPCPAEVMAEACGDLQVARQELVIGQGGRTHGRGVLR